MERVSEGRVLYLVETDFRIPSTQEQVMGILRKSCEGRMWFSTSGYEMSMAFDVRIAMGSTWKSEATSETLRSV